MRGDLVEKTAADVCRDLAAQGASGILAIDGPGGPGRVVLVDGRIIAAVSPTPRARLGDRLVGAGELDPEDLANALAAQQDGSESLPLGSLLVERGLVRRDAVRVFVQEQVLDALFEIIRWRYGAYAFDPDDGARGQGVPLSLSVDDALVEVARRQQEWKELSQVIPDLDSVPSFRTGGATATAALEPDEFAVLASVDGTRSVRALAADLGYGEFEAARIVYGLSLLGVVDVRPPQDEIGAALEDALGLGDFEETPSDGPPLAPVSEEPTTEPAPPPADEQAAEATEATEAVEEIDAVEDTDEAPAEPAPVEEADEPADGPVEPERGSVGEPASLRHDDVPEVWVSSPDDAEPAPPEPATDEHEEAVGQFLDAEVELPSEATEADDAEASRGDEPMTPGQRRSGLGRGLAAIIRAPDDLPEPDPAERDPGAADWGRDDATPTDAPSRHDAPSWEDLAAAAEQAASDPESERDAAVPPQDRITPSAAPTTGPEPGSETPPPDRSAPRQDSPAEGERPDPRSGEPGDTATDDEQPAAATTQRGDDNDVSEFLRELSRLSVDPPSGPSRPRPPSRPTPPPPSGGDHDSKKKRRGLFGRG